MLTVKHRHADGTEEIHTAESVTVITNAGHFGNGIFLDRKPPASPAADEPYTAKHIILFGGDQTASAESRRGGHVWVMNAAGATVATYTL